MISKSDTLELLKESVPNRFMNLSPRKFENFILEFFRELGYKADLTPKTGDYGGDILAKKNRESIVVQVKRYKSSNVVGVHHINQVVGARQFYNANKAIIITTSYFSKNGRALAKRTNVELWDWNILYDKIKKVYLEGKEIYEYFNKETESINVDAIRSDSLEFKIVKILENQTMRDKTIATIIHFKIKNLSNKKINVQMEMPTVIDVLQNQFKANTYLTGYFFEGDIYPNASVESAFNFLKDQVPGAKVIDKMIIKYYVAGHLRNEVAVGVPKDVKIQRLSGDSKCFIATAAYRSELSSELSVFRRFRDSFLLSNNYGQTFVECYYKFSPPIANIIKFSERRRFIVGILLNQILPIIARIQGKE